MIDYPENKHMRISLRTAYILSVPDFSRKNIESRNSAYKYGEGKQSYALTIYNLCLLEVNHNVRLPFMVTTN